LSAEKLRYGNGQSDTQCKYPAVPGINEEYGDNPQSNAGKEYIQTVLPKDSMSLLLNFF
jgi:hypothetical protein